MGIIDFLTGADIDRRNAKINGLIQEIKEGSREEYRYAANLAIELREKHFPENTEWEPLPDLLGVLTQIHNMTSALKRT